MEFIEQKQQLHFNNKSSLRHLQLLNMDEICPYIIRNGSAASREVTYKMNLLGFDFQNCHSTKINKTPGTSTTVTTTATPEVAHSGKTYVRIMKKGPGNVRVIRKLTDVEMRICKEKGLIGAALNNPSVSSSVVNCSFTEPAEQSTKQSVSTPSSSSSPVVKLEMPQPRLITVKNDHACTATNSEPVTFSTTLTGIMMEPDVQEPEAKIMSKIKLESDTKKKFKVITADATTQTSESYCKLVMNRTVGVNTEKPSVIAMVDQEVQYEEMSAVGTSDLDEIIESIEMDKVNRQLQMQFNADREHKIRLYNDLQNCNKYDSYGNLPLHDAVLDNDLRLVKRFCTAMKICNMNIDYPNDSNETPLQLAIKTKADFNILDLLINTYKADLELCNSDGNNILHLAILHSDPKVVAMIVSLMDTNLCNATNNDGVTPLILAVTEKHLDKADILLKKGIDPNIGDKKSGRTALFHAIEGDDYAMCCLLLDYDAGTRIKNFFGTSPYDAMFDLDSVDPKLRNLIMNHKNPKMKYRKKRIRELDNNYDYHNESKKMRNEN